MPVVEGRCLCGAVNYSCDAEPLFAAVCHCRDCQRSTGSAFAVVVGVQEAALSLHGDEPGISRTVGEDHGKQVRRLFCRECGSQLFTDSDALPDVLLVKAGTLDDPSWVQPQLEVWGRSAQPWVGKADGRRRLPRGVTPDAAGT